jgi:hypothetical protein
MPIAGVPVEAVLALNDFGLGGSGWRPVVEPDSRGIGDTEWGNVSSLGCTIRPELSPGERESIFDGLLSFIEESSGGEEAKMSPVSRF